MDGVPTLVTKSYLESIQEEEQRQELNNVKDSHLCVSENAQYKILEVDLRCKESEHQQHIFTTKDRMIITLDIYKYASCSGRLFFIIERMDGVVISHEQYELSQFERFPSSFVLQLSIDSLVLNKGHYQLKFEIYEGDDHPIFRSKYVLLMLRLFTSQIYLKNFILCIL